MTDALAAALSGLPTRIGPTHWLGRRNLIPQPNMRPASVLMLFGRGQKPRTLAGVREADRLATLEVGDVDVLLLQRAQTLTHHPGQPAFPGGRQDAEDVSPTAAALREAREEVGVDPDRVTVVTTVRPVAVPISHHSVTPVVATWNPTPVRVMDTAESTKVYRVAVADLVAPANRGVFTPAGRDYITPVFDVGVLRIWGFTAGLLDFALTELGWARDWPRDSYMQINV